ncbi:MAG: peptidase and chymotrypsin/Hap [Chloroflexi bacterium]|nr:peptidase and chymotrypsin/Hap [Chloroflexota bacterium]
MAEGHSTSRLELWRQRLRRLIQRARGIALFALGMLAALAALLIYNTFVLMPRQLTENDVNHTVAQALASATPPPAISAQVYQVIRPSLVLIQTQLSDKDGKPEYGIGSGVIVDDSGDILTSLHVVADATEIKLTFADGTESTGQVAARQPEDDIAVVRADTPPSQLAPAVLGNPNAMNVGDEAYAVGNPFGLYSSMSAGVISGFNRTFEPTGSSQKLQGLIQIDAAVNPGNSGGPLLNRYGQVIGIVTGIVNPTDQNFFVGIGFAVPITIAGRAAGSPPY